MAAHLRPALPGGARVEMSALSLVGAQRRGLSHSSEGTSLPHGYFTRSAAFGTGVACRTRATWLKQ